MICNSSHVSSHFTTYIHHHYKRLIAICKPDCRSRYPHPNYASHGLIILTLHHYPGPLIPHNSRILTISCIMVDQIFPSKEVLDSSNGVAMIEHSPELVKAGEEQALESHEVIELQTFSERKAWIEAKIKVSFP